MKLFSWIFSGGNYHYVTTGPCGKCGDSTELTLNDEYYLIWLENPSYEHVICPKDVE